MAVDLVTPRPPEQPALGLTSRVVTLTAGQLYCVDVDLRQDDPSQDVFLSIGPATGASTSICWGGTPAFRHCTASYRAATSGNYRVQVVVRNGSGLTSGQRHSAAPLARGEFAPTAACDTVTLAPALEPVAPLNLRIADQRDTTVVLVWDAVTGPPPVVGYTVFLNGTALGTTRDTTATILYLNPNTTYTFTVTAQDAAGSSSRPSNTVSATTGVPPTPLPTAHRRAVSYTWWQCTCAEWWGDCGSTGSGDGTISLLAAA